MRDGSRRVHWRPPARLGDAVLVLASLAFSFALAEGALRLRERGAEPRVPAPGTAGLRELRGVFELGAPNAVGLYKGRVHRTNRHGFRGPEPISPKPPGVFRIVVIGDSFTMGDGVAVDEAYPAQLERILGHKGGDGFEVINLGLSGLNLRYSLDSRLPIGLGFEPDLLIYGFTINDLQMLPGYRITLRAPFSPTSWRLLRLARFAWVRVGERLALPGSYRAELEENYFGNPPVWSEFESDLARLAHVGRERGACVEVLLHAQLADQQAWLDPIYAGVERAARRQGLHVTSSLPVFEGLDFTKLWIDPLDSHPNADGHRLLAEALAGGLASLPEACWKGARPSFEPLAPEAD